MICSTDHFFDQRIKELVTYLIKRGYSRPSLQRAVTRVLAIPRQETLKQQEDTNSTTDPTPRSTTVPHTQQPTGVYQCNHPRCITSPFLQEGQTNYIFTATNEQIQKSYLLNSMKHV